MTKLDKIIKIKDFYKKKYCNAWDVCLRDAVKSNSVSTQNLENSRNNEMFHILRDFC